MKTASAEESSSEFNEFNFWRSVIADIDEELDDLIEEHKPVRSDSESSLKVEDGEDYNEFNFWRQPLMELDLELEI